MIPNLQYLVNGREEHELSPLDRGFSYGDGVFRTLKVDSGQPLSWNLHYKKLLEDCNALKIVCPSSELLLSDLQHLFNGQLTGVAKIVISRGVGSRGYALPVVAQPTRVIIKSELPDYPRDNFLNGVELHVCEMRLSEQPLLAGIKHLNRLENILARMEWTDSAIQDGVLMDQAGRVIECTMSNIFVRYKQRLLTPNLSRCGVSGVTRQRIIGFAEQLELKLEIADLTLPELIEADEVITCNSLYGAWQVTKLSGRQWPVLPLAEQLRSLLQD